MNAPQWAWEAGRHFWADAGGWSRAADLGDAVARACLPVRIDEVADLSPSRVRAYLARRGCSVSAQGQRPLHGCVLAGDDGGWIVIEANDPDDERRYTLAHELAHFLRHRPPPGGPGRLRAVLRGRRTMDFLHLMERGTGFTPPHVREAEEEADWLAAEILAPEEELSARLPQGAGREEVAAVLREAFGLPASAASAHAARLAPEAGECPLLTRLKKY